MTEPSHEVALSSEDISKILSCCGAEALLVGGQALAVWAQFFGVAPTGELAEQVTTDVDFIGGRQVARKLSVVLRWHLYLPTIEDATPLAAKVSTTLSDGGVKQVDFLNAIVGLDTAKVQARASELHLATGTRIRLLSPLDVLESRLRNLERLPGKRNAIGIAQTSLAILVAGKFVEALIESEPLRTQLDAVERIAQIALDSQLSWVMFRFGLNLLDVVPLAGISAAEFQSKRWPRILAKAVVLKNKHIERAARATLLAKKRNR